MLYIVPLELVRIINFKEGFLSIVGHAHFNISKFETFVADSTNYNFTECSETFYGMNCSERCSADCVNNTCEHDTGVCFVYKQVVRKCN